MDKVVKAQTNEHAAANDAEAKAKKAAAAKAFADRQKKAKEDLVKYSKELLDVLAKNPNVKLSKEAVDFFTSRANPVKASSSGSSFFNKVFGDSPKVGDSVTLIEYMKRTLKAKADLTKAIKQWAEKGIVVEVTEKPNQLESVYTIKKL